jgi:hypothetical protein
MRPPRPTFIADASEEAQRVMREHLSYLRRLLRDGRLGAPTRPSAPGCNAWSDTPFRTSLLVGRD